jgi:tetratricopeptide (TPR) repeat protein
VSNRSSTDSRGNSRQASTTRAVCWRSIRARVHDLRRLEEALVSYDRAIALKSDFPQLHFNRGNALALLGRHGEAIAAYDLALAINPGYGEEPRSFAVKPIGDPRERFGAGR